MWCVHFFQEEEHMRLMKLRELNDENKSKSHGNVTRSTSAYGDNKYVWLSCYVLVSNQRPASPGAHRVFFM